ncbi:hypothetical protein K4F52_001444 [Lecanicillium sp. MT-2017a]|nr:hypothetical protein K4F52_001444 [Lecanicillium sp. MT-2017a]
MEKAAITPATNSSQNNSGADDNATGGDTKAAEAGSALERTPTAPAAPYSIYKTWQKRVLGVAAALTAFTSPVSAQIYLPALTPIAKDLHVSSSKINLTITTYMIFQGITPMFVGSFADAGGRRPAYIICFTVYLAANIGLALAPNYAAIMALRCLQSAGSSSTVALSNAVIADVVTSAERGQYVSIAVIPTVLAPALGPIVGGLLSQHLGWRSVFWFLAIFAGVMLQTEEKPGHKFRFKPPNVLGSLLMLFEKESGLILWTRSISFAGFYCNAVAIPTLFSKKYHYDETTVGLMYLPLAAGSVAAAAIVGPSMTWNYKRHCITAGVAFDRKCQADLINFPIERARLEVGLPLLSVAGVCLIVWGWVMHFRLHVAVHCVVSFFMGVGLIGLNNSVSALLVDIHPGKAGTVTAANNLTRCLVGAGAAAATLPLIREVGVGWTFTFIGCLYFGGAVPLTMVALMGMKWRQADRAKQQRENAARADDSRY